MYIYIVPLNCWNLAVLPSVCLWVKSFNITLIIINDNSKINFEPLTLEDGMSRYDVLYLTGENDAVISVLKGVEESDPTKLKKPLFMSGYKDAIILGYVKLNLTLTGSVYTPTLEYFGVTVNAGGFMTLTGATISGSTQGSTNYMTLSFMGTSGSTDYSDYKKLRYR